MLNDCVIEIGDGTTFMPSCAKLLDNAELRIGNMVTINGMEVWINTLSSVYIGNGTTLFTGRLRTGRNQRITVGKDCLFSWEIVFLAHDGHLIWDLKEKIFVNNTNGKQRNSIEIGEHVWVGGETVIMPNTHIGSGSICGYRTLARGTYPNNVIIAGTPGRAIKKDIAWMGRNISNDDDDIFLLDENYRRFTQQTEIMNQVTIAVNICTYHRADFIEKNIKLLKSSRFFDESQQDYFGHLHIFVIDNGSELPVCDAPFFHVFHNDNTGGSGGFQRGIEEIRKDPCKFTHVIFMDDDVDFDLDVFYLLYDFLRHVDEENASRPVAGRMICMDQPSIQYTAAEVWDVGNISHIEYMRDITDGSYQPGHVVYDSGADYGGWWFCCFPMDFVKENDIEPFFLHCDDVEYGLRCGKSPILIEGVQVRHETFEKRLTPIIQYYDMRNPLFVNERYQKDMDWEQVLTDWKAKISKAHVNQDWLTEYYLIRALNDFMKGWDWLHRIHPGKYHEKLLRRKSSRVKNAIFWRIVEAKYYHWMKRKAKETQ